MRKYTEFVSEVDRDKYPQASARYRFSSLDELDTVGKSEGYDMVELKSPEDEGEVNLDLMAFLEAETTREKIEVLDRIKERITEGILCAIEASMDISYENESIEERIYYIRNYLSTRERYEGTRLR